MRSLQLLFHNLFFFYERRREDCQFDRVDRSARARRVGGCDAHVASRAVTLCVAYLWRRRNFVKGTKGARAPYRLVCVVIFVALHRLAHRNVPQLFYFIFSLLREMVGAHVPTHLFAVEGPGWGRRRRSGRSGKHTPLAYLWHLLFLCDRFWTRVRARAQV